MIDLEILPNVLLGLIVVALFVLARVLCRRKAALELEKKNIFLQTLMDSIPSPVFYKDRKGIYVGCNEAFFAMLGRSKEEVLGKTVYDLAPYELAKIYEKADNDLFEDESVQRYETKVQFADGSLRDILFTKSVFRDEAGDVAGLLGVMLDITDRKQAEDELHQAHDELERRVIERTAELAETNAYLEKEILERRAAEKESREKSDFLNTIINSISHSLVVIDVNDHTVKLANTAASKHPLGKGILCHDLLHGGPSPCIEQGEVCPLKRVKETGKPTVAHHEHLNFDGSKAYVEIHASPVFDDNGEVVQVVENIMDITSRKQAEKAMIEAKEMAETTSRLMSEFLDTVSHELRTPMTSVHGFAKLIDRNLDKHISSALKDDAQLQPKVERIKENLEIIISESERLTELINDHLDLSKLESGRIEWRNDCIDPATLVRRAQSATLSLFDNDSVVLDVAVDDELPGIQGDGDRLLQVLINLVSNAAKFTSEGAVVCKAERVDDKILFSVQDSGIGIPAEQQEQIFSKFSQVHSRSRGKPSGTGLGLAISKKIVEHHGGTIWVESEPGMGSTFGFTIPLSNH